MPSPSWQKRLSSLLGWGSLALGSSAFCLLVFQALFGRQLEQLQTIQLGRDLALNVRLTELALERYPPHLVAELTGLDLVVTVRPKASTLNPSPGFKRQADALQEAARKTAKNRLKDESQDSKERRSVDPFPARFRILNLARLVW